MFNEIQRKAMGAAAGGGVAGRGEPRAKEEVGRMGVVK